MAEGGIAKKQDRFKPVPPPKPTGCSLVQNPPKVIAGVETSTRCSASGHEVSVGHGLKSSVARNRQIFPVPLFGSTKANKESEVQKVQETYTENLETIKSLENRNIKSSLTNRKDLIKPEILPKPQTAIRTPKLWAEIRTSENILNQNNSSCKQSPISSNQVTPTTSLSVCQSTSPNVIAAKHPKNLHLRFNELTLKTLHIKAPVANFEEFECLAEDSNRNPPLRPPRSPKNKPFQGTPFQRVIQYKQSISLENTSRTLNSCSTLLKSREDCDIHRQKYLDVKLKSASLGRCFGSSFSHSRPGLDSFDSSDIKLPIPPPRRRKRSATETTLVSKEKVPDIRFSDQTAFNEDKTHFPEYATVNYSKKRNRSIKQCEESKICSQKITFFGKLEQEDNKCRAANFCDKSKCEMCSDKQAEELDKGQGKSILFKTDTKLQTSKVMNNVKVRDEIIGSFMNPVSPATVSEMCSLDNVSDVGNVNSSAAFIKEDKDDKAAELLRKDATYQSQQNFLTTESSALKDETQNQILSSISDLHKIECSTSLVTEKCVHSSENQGERLPIKSSCFSVVNNSKTKLMNVISQVEDDGEISECVTHHTSFEVVGVYSKDIKEICGDCSTKNKTVTNTVDLSTPESRHVTLPKNSVMSPLEVGHVNSTLSDSSKNSSTHSLPCRTSLKNTAIGKKSLRRLSWSSYKDHFHLVQKECRSRGNSAPLWYDDGDLSSGVLADLDSSDNTARHSSLEDVFQGSESDIQKKFPWWVTFRKCQKDLCSAEECASVSSSSQDIDYSLGPPNRAGELFSQNLNSKPLYSKVTSSLKFEEREDLETAQHSDSEAVSSCSREVDHSLTTSERKANKAFYIAKELMTSEKVFVNVLRLLNIDFRQAVAHASKQQQVIPQDEFARIFNNLPQLQSLNEDLLRDLECRVENWHLKRKIADVIVWKGPFLKLYTNYIQNFETQCNHFDECCQKYPKFAKLVKEFEALPLCQKLSIKHFMLKPVQRIPQYRLLLDDYFRHLDADSPDFEDTQTALKIVSDVADHANRSIKLGDHLSKLLQLQSQLKNYEIIKPGRIFLKGGELLKLSRKDSQPRYFILLSDCLLYTSYYGSGLASGLKVNSELPLGGMKVTTPQAEDFRNEFSIISSTRSFTLMARSLEERQEWVDALQSAIKDYASRQLSFLTPKLSLKAAENLSESFKLGKEVPVWIQDGRVTKCQSCIAVFTVTFRRHHCRACGKVVCSNCSDYRAPLQYKKFHPDRVCEDCFNILLKEYENEGKMKLCIETELDITDYEEITQKYREIQSSFKKLGQHTRRKYKKFVPQRLLEVTANDKGSQMSGWLQRRKKGSWKRYWFVLKDQVLYIYKASEDVAAVETVPMLGYEVEQMKEIFEGRDAKLVFQLKHGGQAPLVFSADTEHSTNRWVSAIREATVLRE